MKARLAVGLLCAACAGCSDALSTYLWGQPSKTPTPAPATTVVPVPATTLPAPPWPPATAPVVTPDCGDGTDGRAICPDIPSNTNPVATVGAKVFFLECDGQQLPAARSTQVGCRIHMDCTAKDASGQPTRAVSEPYWSVNDPTLITFGSRSSYTPAWTARQRGSLTAVVTIDGVQSNAVTIAID
jgi:hypothetical protein